VAWYEGNSEGKTHPVGEKQPNAFGLYDMLGNAEEWCSDWYDGNYYQSSPSDNPKGPSSGRYRVARGGCWNYDDKAVRASGRSFGDPVDQLEITGFRCARD